MSIKYTYKGVPTEVDSEHIRLTTAGKYLEDNIDIEAEGGGGETIPITIRENGVYTNASGYSPVTAQVPAIYVGSAPHTVNGQWVRPADWPNLENLPITNAEGTIYLTYDTSFDFAWVSVKNTTTGSAYKNRYELGYMVGDTFTVIYDSGQIAYNVAYTYMFTDEDKAASRYWILRATGRIKTPTIAAWSYKNPDATTARSLTAANQPILERFGDLPYATTLPIANYFIESDYIKTTGALTSLASCYASDRSLQRFKHDTWNTANVTTFASMFDGCYLLEDLDTDFTNWITSKATTVASMFRYCRGIKKPIITTGWDMQNVTTITGLFTYCMSLPKVIGVENWYLPKCVTLYASSAAPFSYCYSLDQDLDLRSWMINTTQSTAATGVSLASMFIYARRIKKIDISTWDLSKASSLSSTFAYCESLEEVKLPDNIGSSHLLTSVSSVFSNCYSIKSVDFSKIDLSAATNINTICSTCYSLEEFIPPTTEPVGASATNTATGLFQYCIALKELDLSWYDCSAWNYSTVQYSDLFGYSINIQELVPMTNISKTFTISAPNLSHDSLVALFNNLATVSGQTITIGTTNWAKLSNTEIAIATGKGWTIK